MAKDLTVGSVPGTMLRFSGPMILGNLLQQCYNIADTLIVGRVLGAGALAAVGSAYTLMTFLTSVLIGLCMGSSSVCSFYYGKKEPRAMGESILADSLHGSSFLHSDPGRRNCKPETYGRRQRKRYAVLQCISAVGEYILLFFWNV